MKSSLMKLNPVSTFSGEGQFIIVSPSLLSKVKSSRWNVEWVGRVFVLTRLIIPNSPPPNSSFDARASK